MLRTGCEYPGCRLPALYLYAISCAHGHARCDAACTGHLAEIITAFRAGKLPCVYPGGTRHAITSVLYHPLYATETPPRIYDEKHYPYLLRDPRDSHTAGV